MKQAPKYNFFEAGVMKRIMLNTLIFIFFLSSVSFAGVVYVSSFRTSLYKDAGKSAKILTLKRGSKLTVITRKGSWLNVKYGKKRGWVKKLFTSIRKPGKRQSILGSAGTNARIHARRRASSDVTAASARGLMEDNPAYAGRSRSVGKKNLDFDFETIREIESRIVPEEELLKFLADAGIDH